MKIHQLLTKLCALLVFLAVFGNVSAQCPAGIVSYWKLDESGTTLLEDNVGGHDATSTEILTNDVTGKIRSSKYFDGTQTASVSNHADFSWTAAASFSIGCWIKYDNANFSGFNQVFIGKKNISGTGATWYISVEPITGKISFETLDANGNYKETKSPSTVSANTWHYVVAVRDGVLDKNFLYIDGIESVNTSYNPTGAFTTDGELTFANLGGSYLYKGYIDEIAILDEAMSAGTVFSNYTRAIQNLGYCDPNSPVIYSEPVTEATVLSPYSYQVKASCLGAVTYTLVTKPTGMSISPTGLITWTPSAITNESYVKVRAYNATYQPADTQSFRIFLAEAPVCPANLSVLLKLNETAGPNYADQYGSHNATAPVSPVAVEGIVNGAQLFNATTKIDIPDHVGDNTFDWAYTDNFSFEYWMKTSSGNTMVAIGRTRRADDYDTLANWWVGMSGGVAAFSLTDNFYPVHSFEISGGSGLNDNQWHHIVAVRDGSAQKNLLYVDGTEVANVTTNYNRSFKADSATGVSVGYWKRAKVGQNEYHFLGSLDEVAIFSKALSAVEVSANYAAGAPTGHCAAGNYAPVITSTAVTAATEDVPYSYTFTVEENDPLDVITLSAVTKPSWLTFTYVAGQKTATLQGTPLNANVGNHSVTLRVSDGHMQKDQSFTIAVVNVNDSPVITSIPVTSAIEGVEYTYTITVTDEDANEQISITPTNPLPGWLALSHIAGAKTAILSGTPGNDDNGLNAVGFTISDGDVTLPHNFSIDVVPFNNPPVINGQNSLSIDEDGTLTIDLEDLIYEDIDNPINELTLELEDGTNYSISGTTVIPDSNYYGSIEVNITLQDLTKTSNIFPLLITINAVNDAPIITTVPDSYTGVVGGFYVYDLDAVDEESPSLTYTAVEKPNWLDFSVSGTLSGIPQQADKGSHNIILEVSDGDTAIQQEYVLVIDGPDAIQKTNIDGIQLYPVPANNSITIELPSISEQLTAQIINTNGTVLISQIVEANTTELEIDLSSINPGIYFCKLSNNRLNSILYFTITR